MIFYLNQPDLKQANTFLTTNKTQLPYDCKTMPETLFSLQIVRLPLGKWEKIIIILYYISQIHVCVVFKIDFIMKWLQSAAHTTFDPYIHSSVTL